MATKKTPAKTPKAAAPEDTELAALAPKEPFAQAAGDRGEVVAVAYDNEAENDSTCVCTLTFASGETATGSSPRTDNLAADQAAAKAKALHG
jgi:hypothetical protein